MVILLVAAAVAVLALAFVLVTDGRTFGKRLLLFCLGLLETLPRPDSILGELRRVLAPEGRMILSLYRGWSVTGATLSLDWYRRHLEALCLDDVRVLPCRRNQDVVVARASSGSLGSDPDRS